MKRTLVVFTAVLAMSACTPFWTKRDDGATSRSWFSPVRETAPAEDADPGAEIYAVNCAYCHGETGTGDGIFAPDLPVVPTNLTTLTVANGGVFPAERILETIHGYPGKFHRGSMPEFGQLMPGPVVEWRSPTTGDVVMTPKGLLDILDYVESLQAAPGDADPVVTAPSKT